MTKSLLRFCALLATALTASFAQGGFDGIVSDAKGTAVMKNGNVLSVGYSVPQPLFGDGVIVIYSPDLQTVVASRKFGGKDEDVITGVAVAADGSIWICGYTFSNDLPIPASPITGSLKGSMDGFVAKLSPDLKTVLGGMYIGGSGPDCANAIAIGATGDVVVVGEISSSKSLPTINSFDETHNGKKDGFYICLDASAKIVNAASYLGGLMDDVMTSVTIDSKNNAVIGGYTSSDDFPTYPVKTRVWVEDGGCPYYGCTTGHWEESGESPFDNTFGGITDAVVLKFQLSGSPVFSAFFGGERDEFGMAVATGPDDVVYLLGDTRSQDLPIPAEIESKFGGVRDGFYAAISANGLKLVSPQYIGGPGDDRIFGAVASGNVVTAVGTTKGPITETGLGASSELRGDLDGLLIRLSTFETTYTTVFGTSDKDQPLSLAVDSYGDVYHCGYRTVPGSSSPTAYTDKFPFGLVTWRGPTTSSSLCEGTPVNISWSADGMLASDTYSIQRSNDGNTWTTIAGGLKTRSHQWTPKSDDVAGGSVQLRVRSSRGNIGLSPHTYTTGALPVITAQPEGITSCSGRPLTLSVTSSTSSATYQWRKGGANIAGATAATYSVSNATTETSGVYDVVLSTACGSKTSESARVIIADNPVITTQPSAASISAGAVLKLSITAEGPGLSYQWTHNGTAIPAPEGTAATLKIASASVGRQGSYQCAVTSECGRTTKSDEVSVIVTGIDEESQRSFAVWPVPATDAVQLRWDGQNVRSITIIDHAGIEVRRASVLAGTTDAKMTVSDLASGSYTIVLESSVGRLVRRFTVVR